MTIHNFPLAWRWTDPKYVELPADVLAGMLPLDPDGAAALHDRWLPVFDRYGEVIPDRFSQIEVCPTEGTWHGDACRREPPLLEQVSGWLREREPRLDLPVTVSWQREQSLRTTWDTVTRWWDDFFYPGSDDAFVVPDPPRWLLAFHHEDWFSFCRAPKGGTAS
jgi:hypothetical protein